MEANNYKKTFPLGSKTLLQTVPFWKQTTIKKRFPEISKHTQEKKRKHPQQIQRTTRVEQNTIKKR